jgi:hypothetical protein
MIFSQYRNTDFTKFYRIIFSGICAEKNNYFTVQTFVTFIFFFNSNQTTINKKNTR